MKKIIKLAVTVLSLTIVFTLFSGFIDFEDRVMISKKDLPEKAQKFIDDYFGDYYFLRATDSSSYSVMFKGSTQIEFSRNGDWTYVSGHGSAIPTSFIDDKVLSALGKKYTDYSVIAIEKTKKYYSITLDNDTKLRIDMEGNIIKETVKK